MAGSYNHVVAKDGQLLSLDDYPQMVENGGDAYETIEEMYGMIWFLADQIRQHDQGSDDPDAIVEDARQAYREGLALSPGTNGRLRR